MSKDKQSKIVKIPRNVSFTLTTKDESDRFDDLVVKSGMNQSSYIRSAVLQVSKEEAVKQLGNVNISDHASAGGIAKRQVATGQRLPATAKGEELQQQVIEKLSKRAKKKK